MAENKDTAKVKENVKETKTTKTKNTPKKRVVVDRDTEVVFMNNTSGNLFYKCPKTHSIYDLYEYGDTDYITVEQLLAMNNSSRKMLKDLWIILLDVTNKDIDIEDVWKYLGLDNLYNDVVKPEDVDGFITKSTDAKFTSALEKMNKVLASKVIERAIVLYHRGELNSITKVNILKEFVGDDDLFE